jgi:outer membrane biosynthesis protein TonB
VGALEGKLVWISRPRTGGSASSPCPKTRVAVWLLAPLLWLALATEARAQDDPADPVAVDAGTGELPGAGLPEAEDPAAGGTSDPDAEGTPPGTGETPPVTGGEEQPGSTPPVGEQPPQPQPPPVDPAPQPSPSDGPPAGPPPTPDPAPTDQPSAEPTPAEPPVVTPVPGDPAAPPTVPPVASAPGEPPSAAGGQPASIVFTRDRDFSAPPLPPLNLSSSLGGNVEEGTWTDDRGRRQDGSRSGTKGESVFAARGAETAPLPGPLPVRDGFHSGLYVSAGGPSGGSAGGFFVGMLAALAALAVAGQRLGGLVSLALSPPRRTAFALRLDRPD